MSSGQTLWRGAALVALSILILVCCAEFVLAGPAAAAPQSERPLGLGPVLGSQTELQMPQPSQDEVELRGQVVCLAEIMHNLYGTDIAAEHPHVLALRATNGAFYTLLPTKFSEALFVDARLRQRELLLKGRVLAKSHILEVTRTRSIREGVVQDLFYYCSVCHIETVSPGPCACCQGTVELIERPLRRASDDGGRNDASQTAVEKPRATPTPQ